MYVGFVRLTDLYRIYQSIGNKFLNRNIRNVLPPENPPSKNKGSIASIVIKEETPPELFTFNHNGITIAAEQIEFDDNEVKIKVPRFTGPTGALKDISVCAISLTPYSIGY